MTKRKETILTPGEKIAQQILDNYDLKNTQDVQDALKQVFGPIFEAILKGEMQNKVLAMYARGMSQRDIAATIEDMYGFQLSHEQISNITDCVMEEVDRWRTRPLKPFYPFSFVDCIYVSMRTERGVHQVAVYVMLAYDTNGYKDV